MFKTMGYSPRFLLKIGQISTLPNSGLWNRFLPKSAMFKTMGYNQHKESPKRLKIRLRGLWNRFREFGAISRTCQNRPCSKPWAIAQGFCSKSAKLPLLQIHPKLTQRVAKAVKNPFMRALEPFQRVWSDFQDLPKSAMFKTMGYSPGFLLKIGQISTLPNSP